MPLVDERPGTYLLLLVLPHRFDLSFGRRGQARLQAGLYGYAGSALGPGGLAARLRRHLRGSPRRHWHMDYLRPHVQAAGALVVPGTNRLECSWASWVAAEALATVTGFGASDCGCPGHLFRLGERSVERAFLRRARRALGARPVANAELHALIA